MRRAAAAAAVACAAACGSSSPPAPGALALAITDDADGAPLPARVAIFAAADPPTADPIHFGTLDLYHQRQGSAACALAPGVIATWTGVVLATGRGDVPVDARGPARCALAPGRYRARAWHGIDYEPREVTVDVPPTGTTPLAIALHRAWAPPPGTLAADLHVHGATSDDSTMPDDQRVAAQVASGLQVIGFSNHNTHGDLNAAIARLHLEARATSLAASEMTSEQLHANAYPVPVEPGAPRGGGPDPKTIVGADAASLFAIARALSTHPIVQVNHPRFRYGALFDQTHWDGVAWPPPFPTTFDALEVVPGYQAFNVPGDRRLDDTVRDFYTLVDHGVLVAPMGNSDTHDFTWVLDGTARTYVFDAGPLAPFDGARFVAAIRARKTLATTCPFVTATTTPVVDGRVTLTIDVAQASFCGATRARVTVDNTLRETIPIDGTHLHRALDVAVGPHDSWIGVVVDGDGALPLAQTGTYQRDKWKHPGVTPYAVLSPILIAIDHARWP